MERLECLFCEKTYPLNLFQPFCPGCQEPLFYSYAPGKRVLAELEGIFCMPASATTLAGLFKLLRERPFHLAGQSVLVITGSGLKAIKSLNSFKINIFKSSLSNLEEKIGSLVDK